MIPTREETIMVKKRLLAIITMIVMVFAMAPLSLNIAYAEPGDNDLAVTGKVAVINRSLIKKKTRKLDVSRVLSFYNEGNGELAFSKVKGNKKITINKTSGQVKVSKGLKTGTYPVIVSITAAGDDSHSAVTKEVTFKVRITKALKTKKIMGISCISKDGFWFPKAFGEAELTKTELLELGQSQDIEYLQSSINTYADAIRFFRVNGHEESYDRANESVYSALFDRKTNRRSFCKAVLYLISDDYADTGMMTYINSDDTDNRCLGYLKKGSYYYAIDPLDGIFYNSKRWIGFLPSAKYMKKDLADLNDIVKSHIKEIGPIATANVEKYPRPIDEPLLTSAQIRELAASDLTLDQAAAKISTVSDALSFLKESGYVVGKFSYNRNFYYGNSEWVTGLSADFTYRNLAGSCGGTSNLLNRLLKDDFDEEGYVEMRSTDGGHYMNYFKRGDTYYFCDFAGIDSMKDPFSYLDLETTDPQEFRDYFLSLEPGYDDINAPEYLLNLFMYAKNGEDLAPCGRDGNSPFKPNTQSRFPDLYPNDLENLIILLHRDDYPMRSAGAPGYDLWPAETHIPGDDGNYYD